MRMWRTWLGTLACVASVQWGCSSSNAEAPTSEEPSAETSEPTEGVERPDVPVDVAPVVDDNGQESETPPPAPPPPPDTFQPGFHQALRWSHSVGALTTFRMRIPVARAGKRVEVTFRAGDGSLVLQRATVARAAPDGTLLTPPVALTFGGKPGFTATPRQLVRSDPTDFPVSFHDELAITFEVRGALAASAINAFPGGLVRSGTHALTTSALGGDAFERSVGVATVEVEGPPSRAFIALGDSITEGYMDLTNDTRNAWPSLVETQLGIPVVNAGVSGQGFYDALRLLDDEVLAVTGVTDCIVLLGTNDLGETGAEEQMEARMLVLVQRLEPFCHVWVGTLLPKEKTNYGAYALVKTQRLQFNAWLRAGGTGAEVIDTEAVTRRPDDVHRYLDGYGADGIHPSAEGHKAIAAEVARVLREKGVQ
ncbi:GDSL-type esterase/lipase family protein [Myxococcus sp. K15C18031901]|uniref:SGNH/GDSL hydrolase family protein n=1 Tax=Myxococcus dinghuensis TaxID=2906761 RepID=UPI0020A7490D|nr:GDSL-type esterase/lipase family protein [Myxococcus dinghuensis]MCP3098477.1 GDSL-type esterase/lipase family protein [Myxococcus dinghuensis]